MAKIQPPERLTTEPAERFRLSGLPDCDLRQHAVGQRGAITRDSFTVATVNRSVY
jgi:hypothetical protein